MAAGIGSGASGNIRSSTIIRPSSHSSTPPVMPQSEGSSSLRQLENREKARLFARHEKFLLYNYDIQPSISLHFQNPETRTIEDGEVTLYKRMFMAGLLLFFPDIARELLIFLGVAPSQIVLNAWRY
jgi:hypothetical protein